MLDVTDIQSEKQTLLNERDDLIAQYLVLRTQIKTVEIQIHNLDNKINSLETQ